MELEEFEQHREAGKGAVIDELKKQSKKIEERKNETEKLLDEKIAESKFIHTGKTPESINLWC